MTVIHTQTTCC